MIALQLNPAEIINEIANFNRKLAEGVKTLRQVGEIPTGATPREIGRAHV